MDKNMVLVVDFGAQYAQLIARRVRDARIYCEIVPHTVAVADLLARRPAAVILSGGPASAHASAESLDGAVAAGLVDAGVPVLGICYGMQLLAQALGGNVRAAAVPEFGRTEAKVVEQGVLLAGAPGELAVWMSHGDAAFTTPPGFKVLAETAGAPVAAMEDIVRRAFGVQWHPEVLHCEFGQALIENFLYRGAGLEPAWTPSSIIADQVAAITKQMGDSRAICALSGGVDSAVAAALVQRAVPGKLTCVHVDHGLMRAGEVGQIERDFVAATGVELIVKREAPRFLAALQGVTDPETKRKIIGREFIRVFEEAQREVIAAHPGEDVRFLVQGTVYPDVVESGGGEGAANIKSHHNVGGLPDDIEFELVEPLRALFKDEVRAVGRELGVPAEIVERQPFPGPGLGIRVIGEVTEQRLDVLRAADAIVRAELTAAGLDAEIWQCPVVLLADVRSVGVQGDGRTYGHPIVLRPVVSEDAMTADWAQVPYEVLARISNRITNEVPEVNRVVLDITSKPPATIEWE